MCQSKFAETQIVSILKEPDAGVVRPLGAPKPPSWVNKPKPVMNQPMSNTFNSDRERLEVVHTFRSASQC